MLWTLIWLAGVFLGYAIFMSQTPLRGYFSDAFGLVRERGRTLIVTEPEAIGGVRRYDVPGILVAELDVEPA